MKQSRILRIATLVLALVAMLVMLPGAQAYIPHEPMGIGNVAPLADDGGAWEVGAEAAGGSLSSYAYSEASYLYSKLKSCGWNGRFLYSSSLAWEQDFKRTAASGTEPHYLDKVDLMFYVGHGSPSGFTFDTTHDDTILTPSDCNYAWGDGDNEWVALTSCQVLANSKRSQWAACMKGTHDILGFISNASAFMGTATQGYNFAKNICNHWTVTGAWFKACDSTQPGHKVRVLAEERNCFYDKPSASSVCSDAWDYDYWYWDHTCGTSIPSGLLAAAASDPDAQPQGGTMPIFRTPPLSLDEAQSTYQQLGSVFSIPPSATAAAMRQDGGIWRSEANGRELEMDSASGGFNFYDMDNLWSQPQVERLSAARAAALSADDARTIADNFLRENDLMPGDARFLQVVSDTISSAANVGGVVQLNNDTQVTAWEVQYARVLSASVANAEGNPAQTQEFVVVGPGARLAVFVDATGAGAASHSQTGSVLGTLGGWHRVEQPAVSAAGVESVPILTSEVVDMLFNQLESQVVVNTPPIDADQREILSHTLAYWEEGLGISQSEVMPVYALNVRYSKEGELLAEGYAYVPANPNYMRPFAQIESAPTDPVRVGQTIALVATDASRTLADLGYDASLSFALGSGDYIYDWFVDTVDEANRIGSGRTINYAVRPITGSHTGAIEQTIILRVTDIGSADQRSTTANTSMTVQPRLMLPLIYK